MLFEGVGQILSIPQIELQLQGVLKRKVHTLVTVLLCSLKAKSAIYLLIFAAYESI